MSCDHKITPLFVSIAPSSSTKRAVRQTDGRTNGRMDDRTNGRMDKQTNGRMDKPTTAQLKVLNKAVKHYMALKADGRRGRKLIDRRLSSDYDS